MDSRRWSRLAAWLVIVLVPVRIVSLGFLPIDDALRHAGKALTDRTWAQILVLRPEATEDSHPGWHWILTQLHVWLGAQGIDLVFFAVIGLFVLIAGVGLKATSPVAWMSTMLIAYVTATGDIGRWIMGRPYLVSSTVAIYLAGRWSRESPHGWKHWPALALLFSLVAWIHPSFYLFGIPVVALWIVGEFTGGLVLGSAVATGAVIAGFLTGSPIRYLYQSFMHPVWSLSWPNSALAFEFRPANGAPLFMVTMLAVAALTRRNVTKPLSRPVVAFIAIGWALSFIASRFWTDWAFPAALILVARMIEDWLERADTGSMLGRWGLGIPVMVFLAATPDSAGKYSERNGNQYLTLTLPRNENLLPDPGGILYSDDMRIFYEVFFRKPNAPFRYVLGFEPGLMPVEEQELLRKEVATGVINPFDKWVTKMTEKDRLMLRSEAGEPALAGLQWTRVSKELWVGKKVPKP